jgi:hypothetical protein
MKPSVAREASRNYEVLFRIGTRKPRNPLTAPKVLNTPADGI